MRALWALTLAACSTCPQDTCEVELGSFGIVEPSGTDGGAAMIYFHGYGGSVSETLDDPSIVEPFVDAGALVVVPAMEGRYWNLRSTTFGTRDELAFHAQIRDELSERFGVDRFYVAGFSLGASMSWDITCQQSESYSGIYTMSGHLWAPLSTCDGQPLTQVHRHGTADAIFPIGGTLWHDHLQGDLYESWELLVDRGACQQQSDDEAGCQVWSCDGEQELVRCIGDQRHQRPEGWAEDAVKRLGI